MRRLYVHLFLLVSGVYLLCASGVPWIEADFQLEVARQLVTHGTVSFAPDEKRPYTAWVAPNGRYYDSHSVTNAFLMLPFAAAEAALPVKQAQAFSFLAALTGVLLNASTCLVFCALLLHLQRPLGSCIIATLGLAFCTIVFPYSSNNYEGNLNTLMMLAALYFLILFKDHGNHKHVVFCAICAGISLNTRDFSSIAFSVFTAFVALLAVQRKSCRPLVYFILAALPCLACFAWMNYLRTGVAYLSPIANGIVNANLAANSPSGSMLMGLKGLLVGSGSSMFIYSPVLLLALLGWRPFFAARRFECLLVACLTSLWILAISPIHNWFGWSCWGPRYTLEITPWLMLPLGFWLPAHSRIRGWRFLITLVFALGLLIQLAGTLTYWHKRIAFVMADGPAVAESTVRHSQWYDSLTILFHNVRHSIVEPTAPNNIEYEPISDVSLHVAHEAVFTWWNRLWYMGAPRVALRGYLLLNAIVIIYCLCFLVVTVCRRGEPAPLNAASR